MAGLPTNAGSAAAAPPPDVGFVRAYHLVPQELGLSNLALGRLKVARFADLNDPFELTAMNLGNRTARKIADTIRGEYNDHTGLLCFSRDWTNPVLWSHYADRHRGIALGFDLDASDIEAVSYENERIPDFLTDRGKPRELTVEERKILTRTKFHHWQYEEELRKFVALKSAIKEGSMHFVPFSPAMRLREVILGPRSSLTVRDTRSFVCRMHGEASVFKARLAYKFFKVVPDARTIERAT